MKRDNTEKQEEEERKEGCRVGMFSKTKAIRDRFFLFFSPAHSFSRVAETLLIALTIEREMCHSACVHLSVKGTLCFNFFV